MAQHISSLFGFQPRQPVFVRQVKTDLVLQSLISMVRSIPRQLLQNMLNLISRINMSVEVQYLAVMCSTLNRPVGDMFRLKNLLVGSCVYLGKKVSFAECVRAQIKEIYVKGSRVVILIAERFNCLRLTLAISPTKPRPSFDRSLQSISFSSSFAATCSNSMQKGTFIMKWPCTAFCQTCSNDGNSWA